MNDTERNGKWLPIRKNQCKELSWGEYSSDIAWILIGWIILINVHMLNVLIRSQLMSRNNEDILVFQLSSDAYYMESYKIFFFLSQTVYFSVNFKHKLESYQWIKKRKRQERNKTRFPLLQVENRADWDERGTEQAMKRKNWCCYIGLYI